MLPITTTTVNIERPSTLTGDPTDEPDVTVIATVVDATIGAPSGAERVAGGQQTVVTDVLHVPPGTDIEHFDIVTDNVTGDRFAVEWVRRRVGLGLDHVKAGLRQTSGASGG